MYSGRSSEQYILICAICAAEDWPPAGAQTHLELGGLHHKLHGTICVAENRRRHGELLFALIAAEDVACQCVERAGATRCRRETCDASM